MRPKKSLGQNFLIDKNKIREIVNAIPQKEISTIVEVGPGKGAITISLIEASKEVIAIEIDLDMVNLLNETINSNNFELIHRNVLDLTWDEILKGKSNIQFVSNLPYYISTKIMFKVAQDKRFDSMSVMLQKELVDRIFSKTNNKSYGRLTVAIGSIFTLEKRINVSAGCFYPKPKVDSGFIILKRKEFFDFDIKDYLHFIKCSFAMKRKTLINSLKTSNYTYYPLVLDFFRKNNIRDNTRSEEVEIDTFMEIYRHILEIKLP